MNSMSEDLLTSDSAPIDSSEALLLSSDETEYTGPGFPTPMPMPMSMPTASTMFREACAIQKAENEADAQIKHFETLIKEGAKPPPNIETGTEFFHYQVGKALEEHRRSMTLVASAQFKDLTNAKVITNLRKQLEIASKKFPDHLYERICGVAESLLSVLEQVIGPEDGSEETATTKGKGKVPESELSFRRRLELRHNAEISAIRRQQANYAKLFESLEILRKPLQNLIKRHRPANRPFAVIRKATK